MSRHRHGTRVLPVSDDDRREIIELLERHGLTQLQGERNVGK